MRKVAISVLIVLVLTLALCVSFAGATSVDVLEIKSDLYIGEYESGGLSGSANIVFGTVSESATVYGVVVTDKDGNKMAFAGRAKGVDGRFAVAIYDMPTGEYFTAQVYSGNYENLSEKVGFWANESNEVVVTYNWTGTTKADTVINAREGSVLTAPDVSKLTIPKNSVFGGWYNADGEKFDFSESVYDDQTLYLGWVSNGTYDNVVFDYDRDDTSSYVTNIGSSAPVDLSDGSSVTMELDVLSANVSGNYQISVHAMAWLPNGIQGTPYNNHFTSTGHLGFAGNSAYTSTSYAQYYGYYTSNGPASINSSNFEYSSHSGRPADLYKAGTTVRVVYTAPTATTTGSFVYYSKPSCAPESAFVETAYMKGITLTDVHNTNTVYLWLGFISTPSSTTQNMEFCNFRVYKGEQNLPIMLFNHYDTEIVLKDEYQTEMERAFDLTIPSTTDGAKTAFIMTQNPVDLSAGGSITMEMDVLYNTIYYQNIYYGPAIWNELGMENVYGAGFNDSFWYSNPVYANGKSDWRVDDVSNKDLPTFTSFVPQDVWANGNSVKMVYNAPTATTKGSILIYTKLIQEDDSCWRLAVSATNIQKDMVVDTSSVIFGFGILKTQINSSYTTIRLANVRAYTSMGDIPIVHQMHGTYVEDTSYIQEYNVSFDVNGATGSVDDVWVQKGQTLQDVDTSGMTAPEGNEFDCWLDENGERFDENTPITRHLKLTAKWQKDWSMAYNVSGDVITGLTSYGQTLTDLVIPSHIYGMEIKAIGYGAFMGSNIESINISYNVETIYDDAFRGIESLDVVTFESGSKLKVVGDSVFRDCSALSNISLPDSVQEVGELCFFGADQSGYDKLYSLNLKEKEYYSNKYVYELLGEDVMPIGAYVEPSVGYFADGVTLEQVMQDFVDSGCNNLINIGQLRYGTTSAHYLQMLEYLERMGGVMLMKGGYQAYADDYASYGGYHYVDEPGLASWVPGSHRRGEHALR